VTDAAYYVREVERLLGERTEREMVLWLRREGLDPREAAAELRLGADRPFEPERSSPIHAAPHHFAVNSARRLDVDYDEGLCAACGGELVYLGALGRRLHYRCRRCGLEESITSDPTGERERGRAEGELEDPDDELFENRRRLKWTMRQGKRNERRAPGGQRVRLGERGGRFRWWMTSRGRSFPVGPVHETLARALRYADREGYR
jgi:hypothetical protein